jgi:hypothetical protein
MSGPFKVTVVRSFTPKVIRVVREGPPGPRGPGGGGDGGGLEQLVYQLNNVGSFTARHGFSRIPSVRLLTPLGEEVETDVRHAPGQTLLVFPVPFTGTLYVE